MSKQPVTPRLPLFQPTELRDQMRFFQVPARGWAWGLLALLLAAALVFAAMLIGNVAMMLDPAFAASLFETGASGSLTDVTSALVMTPAVFLINNLSIAAFIPVAVLASWLIYKQGFGWLSSVVGRFRWRWWGMALAVFAIGYAIYYAIQLALFGPQSFFGDMSWRSSSLVLIIGIVLTTPLQCAGEEFLVRGLVARSIAAIIRPRLIGLAASAIGSSLLFMWLHSAADVWLNSYYTCVGLMLWWLVWRTGGLEAAVAFHIINNLMSEINVPFTDISQMMDRSAGQGSPWILLDLGVQLILVLLVDWLGRRRGLVRLSAPAALRPLVARTRRFWTPARQLQLEAETLANTADLPQPDEHQWAAKGADSDRLAMATAGPVHGSGARAAAVSWASSSDLPRLASTAHLQLVQQPVWGYLQPPPGQQFPVQGRPPWPVPSPWPQQAPAPTGPQPVSTPTGLHQVSVPSRPGAPMPTDMSWSTPPTPMAAGISGVTLAAQSAGAMASALPGPEAQPMIDATTPGQFQPEPRSQAAEPETAQPVAQPQPEPRSSSESLN